jgi:hypothetical protein
VVRTLAAPWIGPRGGGLINSSRWLAVPRGRRFGPIQFKEPVAGVL